MRNLNRRTVNPRQIAAFILVAYVGACVKALPSPENQFVFVTTSTSYESNELFEPSNVIGMFGVSSLRANLADIRQFWAYSKIAIVIHIAGWCVSRIQEYNVPRSCGEIPSYQPSMKRAFVFG
jgi:hypothetical protein